VKDAQLLERLHRADAYASDTAMPETIWTPDQSLREIERRMGMSERTTERNHASAPAPRSTPPEPEQPRRLRPDTTRNRRGLWAGLTAAVIVLVVGVVAILLPPDGDEPPPPPATNATTTAAPTTLPPLSSEDALAAADGFLSAFNAGDVESVLATLAPNASLGFRFLGEAEQIMPLGEWESLLAWDLAQGTQWATPECAVTEQRPNDITVSCSTWKVDTTAEAAENTGVATRLVLRATPDGVTAVMENYSGTDFNAQAPRFERWMDKTYPGALDEVGFGSWSTREEARTAGVRRAEYAAEWSAFLVETDCDARLLCAEG